jgi:ribosomal protein S18 acetylase RimI-like enzyme
MNTFEIRAIGEEDQGWLRPFFQTHWGSAKMVYSRQVFSCDELPGFAAICGGEVVGLVTYSVRDGESQVVSLDSVREGIGIGSALLQAVELSARKAGIRRVWLLTTNDNLNALRFYQKRGYELVAIHRRAVEQARTIKPEIPLIGNDGIPIRDEIELEKLLHYA